MKRSLIAAALLGVFGAAVLAATPAEARNSSVESALANYSDLSTFYAALLNTGVLNELDENTHYTIFAPTNEAFAEIRPSLYPCFYSVQCRARVADILRDHIVVRRRTLNELTKQAEIPTLGRYRVYAESPFVGDYSVGNQRVLSSAEVRGNMIDRIDGVIITNQQLAQFRAMPPMASGVAEEKTITTYRAPVGYPVPGGGYPAATAETVTEKTYVVPGASSNTVVYPATTQSDDGNTTTVVTHTITTRQSQPY